MPGAGVLLDELEDAPDHQFGATKSKLDLGKDTDLVIKARSITLTDHDDRFIHIGPDAGIQVQEKDGTGVMIKDGAVVIMAAEGGAMKTLLQITKEAIQAMQASGNLLNIRAGNVTLLGTQCSMVFGSIKLGALATPATPVHYGPAPVASIPSTTIWCQQ
jgi:hypothetical protein